MKNVVSPAMPTGTSDWHGLTKREYVATEAMTALIKAYGVTGKKDIKDPSDIKILAYRYADAMLHNEPDIVK